MSSVFLKMPWRGVVDCHRECRGRHKESSQIDSGHPGQGIQNLTRFDSFSLYAISHTVMRSKLFKVLK